MRAYVIADVFTDTPLEGNPVAVFLDAAGLGIDTMQRAARELNLSETVFVLGPDPGADARIRIFTPATEMPFAGHPVLGTAFVLGELMGLEVVRLATGAGVVPIALTRRDGVIVDGEMEQPLPTWEPFERSQELLGALGVERSRLPIEAYT
ncbi:MAG: PhzF family phenazine biosynthesis protein, partial [Solirubrobacteraceae bacterium]